MRSHRRKRPRFISARWSAFGIDNENPARLQQSLALSQCRFQRAVALIGDGIEKVRCRCCSERISEQLVGGLDRVNEPQEIHGKTSHERERVELTAVVRCHYIGWIDDQPIGACSFQFVEYCCSSL